MSEKKNDKIDELNKKLEKIDAQVDGLKRKREKQKKLKPVILTFSIIIGVMVIAILVLSIVLIAGK